ncbi:MAG: DUF5681 domain-containing protein [Planctomycetota bacterium]|jgi:hypothetical protein
MPEIQNGNRFSPRHQAVLFKKGQSGNPKGRPKGTAFIDVLRAYAAEEPNGKPRWREAVEFMWKKAFSGNGNSRYVKVIVDRLIPSQQVRISEDHKSVQVLMQIAIPPDKWAPSELIVDADGDAKLLGNNDSKTSETA